MSDAETMPQAAILRAAIDRIIPPDSFPGAWDVGAGNYIVIQLAGQLRHLGPVVEEGLSCLEREAQQRFGRSFAALDAQEQDDLLACVEDAEVETSWGTPPDRFFALLVRLTNEGYYSDPASGGNRDEVAWRMIGYSTGVPAARQP